MSLPSAEVAADFRDALQDLKVNSRPEISNLTIIAKENTEHAQAISRELEAHIKATQPMWKLPALYVLDSIVKNVGTPYTVYLGRNLYHTFMGAYLVMDPAHRRAMDGLLKTWKQPVPESMDTRPVFPPEVTRDIENALIKIRTASVQQQAQSRPPHGLPPRPVTNPMANNQWRNTPTPPQNVPRYAAPNDPRLRQQFPPANQYGQYPSATPPVPVPSAQPFQPPASSTPISSNDLESLKTDLGKLIASTKSTWETNMADVSIAQKLKALLDLQIVLNTQTVPPQQLQAIRAQVQALSPQPAPVPAFSPPVSAAYPYGQPPQQVTTPTLPPAPLNLAQLLANARPPVSQTSTPVNPTQNLADMLRRMSSPMPPVSTPTAQAPLFPPPPFPPVPQPAAGPLPVPVPTPTPTNNLAALLANLGRPAGPPAPQTPLIPPFPTRQAPPAAAAPGSGEWLATMLKGLPPLPQIPQIGTPSQPTAAGLPMIPQAPAAVGGPNFVEMTSASMKQPRFHLVNKLYGAKPNMCATCGRRFDSTQEGREKKARHMDWHFKVKDPDAQKRGVHRSWYISEREWIEYREVDESSPDQNTGGAKAAAASKVEPKDKYVRVPTDPALTHAPCPICQEKFDQNMKWHVEANDFVWMDAVQVGGKIYHATCWDEYSKGAGIVAPSTPDSVLGKRKVETGDGGSGKKMRAY